MDKKNVWFITTKTNLHVGNENINSYGLIDLAVQRNATTGLPCINSSSLKGALHEFASQYDDLDEVKIFGSDKKEKAKGSKKGQYVFFDADILFLPKQSDTNLYDLVTCRAVLERFFAQVKLLTGVEIKREDLKNFKFTEQLDGKDITEEQFKELCSDENLPIIARNVLDNGESKNLWYEQVVPAETVFYTFIDNDKRKSSDNIDNTEKPSLEDKIKDAIVQIGANASIGYGYCKFNNLK